MRKCGYVAAGWSAVLVGLFAFAVAGAEELRFDNPAAWQDNWQLRQGLAEFDDDGRLGLVRFSKSINAVSNAHLFVHPTLERGEVAGGIWSAGSNASAAEKIIDGDAQTFWQADAADPLAKWVVQVNLGRAVMAEKIRLRFPDEDGARPFRQFTLFASTGAHVAPQDDVFRFTPVFTTTKPNTESVIEFGLRRTNFDTTKVMEVLPGLELESKKDFQVIQFLRFVVDQEMPEGALAEIEVFAVGDNVAIGTPGRGGTFTNGNRATDPFNLLDGQLDTYGVVEIHSQITESRGTAFEAGLWWEVDLGAVFWVDEAFYYWQRPGEQLSQFRQDTNNAGTGYEIWSSDGTQALGGELDFDLMVLEPEWTNTREQNIRHFRYLFQPRKVRHLYWVAIKDLGWRSHPMELMLFSEGHPAEVRFESNFLDLGALAGDGQSKVIRRILWDAEMPPGTSVKVRSRSGDILGEEYTFYDRAGNEVTEARWSSAPVVLRGAVDTTVVIGSDWDEWSNTYQFSGEDFQSQSPRRFVQLELIMASEDPQVAAKVNGLTVEFVDALLQEAQGAILPRQVRPNEDTRFTYTLWPQVSEVSSGFDVMRFVVDGLSQVGDDIQVLIDNRSIAPMSVSQEADSLLIALPERVAEVDSVQVSFTTRLLRNATVFGLDLGTQDRPGLWQDVSPVQLQSNVVLLPDLADSKQLIQDLVLHEVFTPNGDGVNDALEISFVVFKAQIETPQVRVYDLSGRQVAEVPVDPEASIDRRFVWDGRNAAGQLVRPGTYVVQVDLAAESGKDSRLRPVVVAY